MSDKQAFKPVRTKRAFEEICTQIRHEIQSGSLSAGDKLPSERELAEQFEVSRSTVREAFRTLEMSGVLSLQKGMYGGAVVMQGDPQPITQTMQDLLSLGGLSLEDYTEARVCLQREIIRLACERGTEEDFDAIKANIASLRAAGPRVSGDERTRMTQEFYDLLAKATKNRAMSVIMSAFTVPLGYYLKQIGPDRSWDVAASREKFLKHLRKRDVPAAVAEMTDHMQRLHAYLLSRMSEAAHASDKTGA
ncbi:FadR/GntR family transcriptional regulator [Ciceribacter naphthalenivorans]|uniref:GntR family transcriptional regulator n=2 Tax=Alphaproteobacteria TaxID=28211 RepID=A0A512HNP6_9HYPH|nr:GntR family transcriptional regulator [Ciceribacter naphthalenivorans]GEO87063.1 GntR family transcriptional regulator [Ciceribacter naphthalenivorans]GLR23151.1 GntR family transcriptional regulator [Ciceribacter naphthalenivorans]GLT06007.1 GntR family transcriptional regulator [Sphingomonas psychrolutea]